MRQQMDRKIEDYFPEYPDITAKNFQTLLSERKEFAENKTSAKEKLPSKRGQNYKHQEIIHRYLLEYGVNILNINEPGTGKSQSVIYTAEWYKKHHGYIKHIFIFVKGKSLKDEIQYQIVCKSISGDYDTEKIRKSKGAAQKANITREVKKWYTITTYGSFVNKLRAEYWRKGPSGEYTEPDVEAIRRAFSGNLFWLDEAHYLIVDPQTSYRDTVDLHQKKIIRNTMWELLHIVQRSLVILTTGTPFINSSSDVGSLANIILPADLQIPADFDYNNAGLEEYRKYFQGRVSYVRALDTGAIPVYIGEPIGMHDGVEYQTILYTLEMSDHQSEGYQRSHNYVYSRKDGEGKRGTPIGVGIDDVVDTEAKDDKISKSVYMPWRQAANFVFPDGSFGSDGFNKYVISRGSDNFVATPELAEYLTRYEDIYICSCKYGDICRRLTLVNGIPVTPGNFFIYGNFYEGSGIIVLGLCLEGIGYEKFNESASIFTRSGNDAYCESFHPKEREIRPGFPKKPRYAIIGRETLSKFPIIMETFNSYENRHGDYIKVLLSTPMGRDGINVYSVLYEDLIDSEWNPAATLQAESRGIRSNSHQYLLDDERDRRLKLGLSTDDITIDIEIRHHAAIDKKGQSINVDMYMHSEDKNRKIRYAFRKLKQLAFDGPLNYERNVRPEKDVDGSAACDYDVCQFELADPLPTKIDTSTYDLLYSDKYLYEIGLEIREYFRSNFAATIQTLYAYFSKYESRYIDMALDKLLHERRPLFNRFGLNNYIHEDAGVIYLTHDYPVANPLIRGNKYSLLEYSNKMIVETNIQLEMKAISDEGRANIALADVDNILKILPWTTIMRLFEEALIRDVKSQATEVDKAIMAKLSFFYYKLYEPIAAIEAKIEEMIRTPSKAKKASKNVKIPRKEMENIIEATSGDIVYIHILNILSLDKMTSYDLTSTLFKADTVIRIYNPKIDTEFRNTSEYEQIVYNKLYQRHIFDIFTPYQKYGIYGTLINGTFRIHDYMNENKSKSLEDNRFLKKGRICTTYLVPNLIYYLSEINAPKPDVNNAVINAMSRDAMITYLLKNTHKLEDIQNLPDNKLRYYISWHYVVYGKDGYCEKIYETMMRDGKILKIL